MAGLDPGRGMAGRASRPAGIGIVASYIFIGKTGFAEANSSG